MKFIDFFSGIGGFRLGLEMAGYECVGHCEIDKYADKSYRAMHEPKEGEWFADDITTVEPGELPDADIFCGGFPCQAFSIAGKRGGFEDTRGTLFFEVMRLAKERKPQYLFLENVAGLLNHDGGRTFGTIISTMEELGYSVEWQVLNSNSYLPQNRERVFIIGLLGGGGRPEVFPIRNADGQDLKQIIGGSQGYRVYDPSGTSVTLASQAGGMGSKTGLYFVNKPRDIPTEMIPCQVSPKHGIIKTGIEDAQTLCARDYKGITNYGSNGVMVKRPKILRCARTDYGKEVRKKYEAGEIKESRHNMTKVELREDNYTNTPTITCGGSIATVDCNGKEWAIRRLTPKECFRLQGFPDELFEKAAKVNSDSQLYKQAGNSVTVPVIYDIARRLK